MGLLLGLVMGAPLAACAPTQGWTRASRVCERDDPPRVCFEADPDLPATLRVGGETLVPGECAFAPRARGGSLRVELGDGRGGEGDAKRVRVRGGRTTMVTAHGPELELDVTHSGCDARPNH